MVTKQVKSNLEGALLTRHDQVSSEDSKESNLQGGDHSVKRQGSG